MTTSADVAGVPGVITCHFATHTHHNQSVKKAEEMATWNNFHLAFLVALTAAFVPADASAESTRMVELDIRPGGVVQTFTEAIVIDYINFFFIVMVR